MYFVFPQKVQTAFEYRVSVWSSADAAVFFRGQFIKYDSEDTSLPQLVERRWINYPLNFDNVPNGLLTLFVASTFEGWPALLYQ